MGDKHTIDLNHKDIEYLIGMYGNASKALDTMMDELCRRLADMGQEKATVYFSEAIYDGTNDANVTVEKRDNGYAVVANGESVLFIEFGTGINFPDSHPEASKNGMKHGDFGWKLGRLRDGWRYPAEHGAGTNGFPDEDHPGYLHTMGNPANMPMYKTVTDLDNEVERMIKEVFDLAWSWRH